MSLGVVLLYQTELLTECFHEDAERVILPEFHLSPSIVTKTIPFTPPYRLEVVP